jgi:hypothetical protein
MEAVEGDPGVGQMLPLSLPVGGGHVHADLPDPVRVPPVGLQIFSEKMVHELTARNVPAFRTGEHYHSIFRTDGALGPDGEPSVTVEWTHG